MRYEINLIFILRFCGQLHEHLEEEQQLYKLGFDPSKTSFAALEESLRCTELQIICKHGKTSLFCLTVALDPNADLSDFFKDNLCTILPSGTVESLIWT